MRVLLLLSGGVDSTVLAYQLAEREGYRIHAVSFRYGQRNADREIAAASRTCVRLSVHHDVISVAPSVFARTPLTGFGAIPHVPTGDAEGTAPIVLPGRNIAFLSAGVCAAAREGITSVYFAPHRGDAASFPDCRPEFVNAFNGALRIGGVGVEVRAPFLGMDKAEIVRAGQELGVRWQDAYSCYEGSPDHCGKCGACLARAEAFRLAAVADDTEHRYGVARV